ncbi:hypothetical protein [Yokenella regensburgei]|uniref:Fimbrial protein n=1 Tax=Yokenella regensburgei TaxID=158877 RepID=A0AB38FUI2_9ENTR|nr:hypothetical protein [Yokenella regensburgei]KFD24796.1 hypothetical protein GYRE_00765 [Yokenella regensburgei ATCC 49455]SQA62988.1 Uncharacterised protein [Yokenella regensburgei]SQB02232.1 Uncharacterised protein [Yokenella regensburgei]SUQ07468.1 Uncharacterised protein [Yokenella regensburgei]
MKFIMKKNMTALAMSVAMAAGTLGCMNTAQADPVSADFSNNIHVISVNTCDIDVSLPTGSRDFVANWTRTAASGSTMAVDAATLAEPPEILVAVNGGAGCKLDKLTLTTDLGAGVYLAPGGTRTFLKAVDGSSNGGYWRFTPTLAKATLYGDAAATSGATTSVDFIDPAGVKVQQSTTAKGNQNDRLDMEGAGVKGVLMTNNYFTNALASALVSGTANETQLIAEDTNTSYKAMKIGISAILGTDPESAAGTPSALTVAEGDSVDIPFTINISPS